MICLVEIKQWVKDIVIYFEFLNNINLKLFKLCSLDCWNDITSIEKYYLDISQDLFRLLPCSANTKLKKINLIESDGIFSINDGIEELKGEIKKFVLENNDILYTIKYIRNKTEHMPHKLKAEGFYSGSTGSDIRFSYENESLNINFNDLKKLVIKLNEIFIKMQNDLSKYQNQLSEEYKTYPCWDYLKSMNFEIYNKLLLSKNLYDISFVINKY